MPGPPLSGVLHAVVAGAVLLLAGCAASPAGAPAPSSGRVSAAVLLAGLPVEPEGAERPYDRDAFGYEPGFDPDGDGCYTWREVLIRDSRTPVTIGRGCTVHGSWRSPFDGVTTTDPRDLSIDHLVPLLEAWRSGAWRWDAERLTAYGNDLDFPYSLQAVTASLNEDKGNADPATWLPPVDRCGYAKEWIAVKARWSLSVDRRERDALDRLLGGCDSLDVSAPGSPDVARLSGRG